MADVCKVIISYYIKLYAEVFQDKMSNVTMRVKKYLFPYWKISKNKDEHANLI
jgi:hypothetical protein